MHVVFNLFLHDYKLEICNLKVLVEFGIRLQCCFLQ